MQAAISLGHEVAETQLRYSFQHVGAPESSCHYSLLIRPHHAAQQAHSALDSCSCMHAWICIGYGITRHQQQSLTGFSMSMTLFTCGRFPLFQL